SRPSRTLMLSAEYSPAAGAPLAGPRGSAVRFSRAVSNHPPRNSGVVNALEMSREEPARVGLEVSREIAQRQGDRAPVIPLNYSTFTVPPTARSGPPGRRGKRPARDERRIVRVRADAPKPALPVTRKAPPQGRQQASRQFVLSAQRRVGVEPVRIAARCVVGELEGLFPARHLGERAGGVPAQL